jgi:hypothetical protein
MSSLLLALTSCIAVLINKDVTSPGHELDFWVGDWTCSGESYDAAGKATHTDATNTITRAFDGHVIKENFTGANLTGMSVSVYDANNKLWRQTWVDNQGGYIALTGKIEEGNMTLTTLARAKTPNAFARMVFKNVKPDSFDWNWEGSKDGGKTWKLSWHLHYTRVKDK